MKEDHAARMRRAFEQADKKWRWPIGAPCEHKMKVMLIHAFTILPRAKRITADE
jgi:hypothetical protein